MQWTYSVHYEDFGSIAETMEVTYVPKSDVLKDASIKGLIYHRLSAKLSIEDEVVANSLAELQS